MIKYKVFSRTAPLKGDEGPPVEALEAVRTDRLTANHDADLIRSTLFRKAWVEEVEVS